MICNAATETAADDASSRLRVQRYVSLLESAFRDELDNAVACNELVSDLDTAGWSRKLATILLGMMVLIRSRVDPALAQGAAAVALRELRDHA